MSKVIEDSSNLICDVKIKIIIIPCKRDSLYLMKRVNIIFINVPVLGNSLIKFTFYIFKKLTQVRHKITFKCIRSY